MVGDEETRVVENSPTFTQPLMPQTEANEGDTVQVHIAWIYDNTFLILIKTNLCYVSSFRCMY